MGSDLSTHILLIRHGETDWNAQGRIQGHLQVPLNARGLRQADALARRLAGSPFAAVHTSDLVRARQTAEAVADVCGLSVQVDERLREWDLGILAGMNISAAAQEQPDTFRIYRERIVDLPIPGGESIRQRFARVTECIEEIADVYSGQTLVVVSHGGPLGDCYRRALDIDPGKRIRIDLFNAAINRLRINGDNWEIDSWADTAHLESIGSLSNLESRKIVNDG